MSAPKYMQAVYEFSMDLYALEMELRYAKRQAEAKISSLESKMAVVKELLTQAMDRAATFEAEHQKNS